MVTIYKPRERLIRSALDLFGTGGFHATGIDTILSRSKVSKTTLYRHFRSKDELIIATLRKRDEEFRNWFMQNIDHLDAKPIEKLLMVFDVYKEWAEEPKFNGCIFAKASAEFPSTDSPIHRICIEHKRLMIRYLKALSVSINVKDPDELAEQIMILLDGATVSAQITGQSSVFKYAKESALKLVT